MPIKFSKYQGTGNDFILFDNREGVIDHNNTQWIRQLCDRRFGIGADGVMLLENELGCDFRMVYYNADGNISSMCGNGGRCIINFANTLGIIKENYVFNAVDGLHEAYIKDDIIYLKMNDVPSVLVDTNNYNLNTGSPHYVSFVEDTATIDIKKEGAAIRYHSDFAPAGTNVNFIDTKDGIIHIRTYERGVEDETLSCGTGVTAAAIVCGIAMDLPFGQQEVQLQTMGGRLKVRFDKQTDGSFTNIWLIGPGVKVFDGIVPLPDEK